MINPPSSSPTDPDFGSPLAETLASGPGDTRWRMLELEIAREQRKVLQQSVAQTSERIERLTSELRMLPWNWARTVRDARFALTETRAALNDARERAEEAHLDLQRATDELVAAEARLAPGQPDRRSPGLGLLIRRRRRHDGTLLDLRMSHALAGERLREALECVQQARGAAETREQALSEALAGRRRQRSILIQEIESLSRRLQREEAQCRECEQIVAEIETHAVEDSTAPA